MSVCLHYALLTLASGLLISWAGVIKLWGLGSAFFGGRAFLHDTGPITWPNCSTNEGYSLTCQTSLRKAGSGIIVYADLCPGRDTVLANQIRRLILLVSPAVSPDNAATWSAVRWLAVRDERVQ